MVRAYSRDSLRQSFRALQFAKRHYRYYYYYYCYYRYIRPLFCIGCQSQTVFTKSNWHALAFSYIRELQYFSPTPPTVACIYVRLYTQSRVINCRKIFRSMCDKNGGDYFGFSHARCLFEIHRKILKICTLCCRLIKRDSNNYNEKKYSKYWVTKKLSSNPTVVDLYYSIYWLHNYSFKIRLTTIQIKRKRLVLVWKIVVCIATYRHSFNGIHIKNPEIGNIVQPNI